MKQNRTIVIKPKNKWFDFNFSELWAYRDLIFLFVKRDFIAYYKQTILGPLWFIIQPVFTTIIFTVIFGTIAKIPTASGIPQVLFYLSGIVNWNYFAECVNKTSNSFTVNAAIFGKVYFPRLAVPISIVMSNMITYLIQFSLFIIIFIYQLLNHSFHAHLDIGILIVFLLILQMALLGLGVGIIVSALTTKYKDLILAVGFCVQLWMYATPIVYPLSQVPLKWKWVFYLNPMSPVVEVFRHAFFNVGQIDWMNYLGGWILTLFILFVGIILFNRVQKSFMDTI